MGLGVVMAFRKEVYGLVMLAHLRETEKVNQDHSVNESQPADQQSPSAPLRRRSRGGAPTIYDVAKLAGVAPSTVSRAFARPGRVSYETAERIREAAHELGYRARTISRHAEDQGGTHMIALVVTDISNPVFFEVIRGVEEAAAEAGYTLLLANSQESDRREREALERVLPLVDGVLLASSRMSDSAVRAVAKQKPTIIMNRAVAGVVSVVTDNPTGTRRAVEHLARQGCKDVTYVAGPETSWADGMRWRAVREAGMEHHLRIHRIGPAAPNAAGGRAAALAWADNRTPGVICYNDLVAMGFVRTVHEMGLRIPEDVAVIGYDNIMSASFLTPGLSTIAAPMHAVGATGAKNLVAMIKGASPTSNRPLVLATKLVIRSSSDILGRLKAPGESASV